MGKVGTTELVLAGDCGPPSDVTDFFSGNWSFPAFSGVGGGKNGGQSDNNENYSFYEFLGFIFEI